MIAKPGKLAPRAGIFVQLIIFFGLFVAGYGITELILRNRNASMQNYDIEMWRYAKELKIPSHNPAIGHEHLKNASSILQSVEIRTNSLGMRGGEVDLSAAPHRRILFLGSSITLGWGVSENDTVSQKVESLLKADDPNVEVLNGGIGNFNAARYVALFLEQYKVVKPTDIVVHFFLRDAEALEQSRQGNWLLRNSQFAAIAWMAFQHKIGAVGSKNLINHYQDVFEEHAPGFLAMKMALAELAQYANQHGIRIYLAMIPDVHNLTSYPFKAQHTIMSRVAEEFGYQFIDLYPSLAQQTPETIWAMPGDPHPNALGHAIMASDIANALRLPSQTVAM